MSATIERAAMAVYEKMRLNDPEGRKYPWVTNGNSHKQREAREYVRAVLEAIRNPNDAVILEVCAWGVCAGNVESAWNAGIDAILKGE